MEDDNLFFFLRQSQFCCSQHHIQMQIIESLTSKIIEPLTENTWAQGYVIQQREKWPRVEFTSLNEENILNE